MTLLTASPLIALALILALLIGYLVGKSTGEHHGYLKGAAEEHRASLVRVIRTARNVFKAGRDFERRFPSREQDVVTHERN